ncbi:glycophorin-A isoform X2 [Phacochoerus africanus]|uniref:glycophorin-A isoform X2 n=1 Tax=Phacochoerus africanus TaxID=41426 RepID=UPI001FD89CF2|nr:glycophorin-A isoform X2 [Phacochoerus africanus]
MHGKMIFVLLLADATVTAGTPSATSSPGVMTVKTTTAVTQKKTVFLGVPESYHQDFSHAEITGIIFAVMAGILLIIFLIAYLIGRMIKKPLPVAKPQDSPDISPQDTADPSEPQDTEDPPLTSVEIEKPAS